MINDIIGKIGKSINEEFNGDCQVYSESMPQEFETPCFFVECANYIRNKALSSRANRFYVTALFRVTYFPDEKSLEQNNEIWNIADRIFDAVEYIDGYSGDDLKAVVSDGVLIVTVSYSFQAYKETDKTYMDRLRQKGGIR